MTVSEILSAADWKAQAIARCRRALEDAKSVADRLALLRSLSRLHGGRTDLDVEKLQLSMDELAWLPRFGLAVIGRAVRILDEEDSCAPTGFWEADRLDTNTRRIHTAAPPDAILIRHTNYESYSSSAQKAGIRAVLTMPPGAGLMVGMPTGSGKSLLFQLDALRSRAVNPGSCTVVITPTVALALDHARTLSGIPGLEKSRALTGNLTGSARLDLLDEFRRGEIPILFLSPEFALGPAREALLEAALPSDKKYGGLAARLRAMFIDEAHIVESWGRTFRPDFQRLPALSGELREANPSLNVVLLSATLPPAARKVLRSAYGSRGPWLEINAKTPRYELDVVVESFLSTDARQAALDFVIDRAPRPMIVYTTLVDESEVDGENERTSAEELFERLKARQYDRIALFTGNVTDSADRLRIIEDWAQERLDIVVATSAFGLGVDKSNVRTIVHACLPEGPSRWYQEIGRASRDGHQGLVVCLFTKEDRRGSRNDVRDAFQQATGSWLTLEKARPRWHALVDRCSNVRWKNADQQMTLDLDAAREGIKSRYSSDYNRTWNMSLLNLMQRAAVLEVLSTASGLEKAFWDVQINDPAILTDDDAAVWTRVFAIRDSEQWLARAELNRFLQLMRRPSEDCLLRGVFELIEEELLDEIPPCGRCPSCRKNGRQPPHSIKSWGLEEAWPFDIAGNPSVFPPGATLIVPEDPTYESGLKRLIQRLATAGVEQFVIPDVLVPRVAQVLADSAVHFGFVLSHSELTGQPVGLAQIPTALLLPQEEILVARLLSVFETWRRTTPHQAVAIIAQPERKIRDRRLDQTISNLAPYAEGTLDNMAISQRDLA